MKPNFIYNFLYRLGTLKTILLNQFVDDNDDIEMIVRKKGDTTIEEFYETGSDEPCCTIVYSPRGIVYYE